MSVPRPVSPGVPAIGEPLAADSINRLLPIACKPVGLTKSAKVALAVLGTMSPHDLANAIAMVAALSMFRLSPLGYRGGRSVRSMTSRYGANPL